MQQSQCNDPLTQLQTISSILLSGRKIRTLTTMSPENEEQLEALGDFIRAQRKAARMSLRDLAAKAGVSNPYISQIERGLHEPSMRVLRGISGALNMPVDELLIKAGLIDAELDDLDSQPTESVEAAIENDPVLTEDQRDSLLAVYRSYVAANDR